MMSFRCKHRWLPVAVVIAWSLSNADLVQAQNDPPRPLANEKIRRSLDQVIALDYQGNSFADAITHVKERTQLPIQVDPMAIQQLGLFDGVPLNIELRNVRGKLRNALTNLLGSHNLTYVILEDSLLITTEENGFARQMRQRLPVNVADVPAATALRDLSRQAGVSLVIDPRVAKSAAINVTLQLDDATVDAGLRLLAELVDLKAVRVGNVIFVTDPSRGDRLRKEEAFNNDARFGGPNILIDRVAVGGVGGGIGIAPLPAPEPAPAPANEK